LEVVCCEAPGHSRDTNAVSGSRTDHAPPHPPVPTTNQRQGRTLQPHPRRRMGLCTALPIRDRTRSRLRDLAPSLQSPPTPYRTRRLNPHPTRSQPHGEEQLVGIISAGGGHAFEGGFEAVDAVGADDPFLLPVVEQPLLGEHEFPRASTGQSPPACTRWASPSSSACSAQDKPATLKMTLATMAPASWVSRRSPRSTERAVSSMRKASTSGVMSWRKTPDRTPSLVISRTRRRSGSRARAVSVTWWSSSAMFARARTVETSCHRR